MKNKMQDQLNSDALLREVVDEVKTEQLHRVWNKYGLFIIVAVAFVLTAAISFENLKNWYLRKNQELSDAYSVALSLQAQGRFDESLDIYKTLAAKAGGIYADIAKLQMAGVYLEQNQTGDAFAVLQALIDDSNTLPQLKNIAALKLAAEKLNTSAPAEEISSLLQPMLDGNHSDIARELNAMLFIREKKIPAALNEYALITSSATASDVLKSRAQDMINLLSETK